MSLFGKSYDLSLIKTTSKDALKKSAIIVADGDISKAKEIYDYFIQDMEDMPPYDIPQPSGFEQVKTNASQLFGWIEANGDKLVKYVNIIQGLRGKSGIAIPTTADVPPIP